MNEFYVTMISYINICPHSHSNTTAKHSSVALSYPLFLGIISPLTNIASHELFLTLLYVLVIYGVVQWVVLFLL